MMNDGEKTKEQLIGELSALRQRIAEWETAESRRKQVEEVLTQQKAELSKANTILEEKNRLLKAFQQIGQVILSSLDLDEVLNNLGRCIIEAGIFRSLMIALVDESTQSVEVVQGQVRSIDYSGPILRDPRKVVGLRYSLDDVNITAEVARTGAMQVIEGWDDRFGPVNEDPEAYKDKMSYFIPVKKGDRIVAVLATGSRIAEKEEVLQRIQMIGPLLDEVAIAVEHAQLFQEVHVTEQELRQSEARLVEAKRIAHLGSWDWDMVKDELRWSEETYRIFGLSPQESAATYEAFLNAVHPDDREMVQEAVDTALYEHTPYRIDHRIVRADGVERVVHAQAEVFFDANGRAIRMAGTVQDITERKQTEDALRESEERYRHLVKLSPDTIAVHSEGKMVFINPAGARLLGAASPEQLMGKPVMDFVHPDDLDTVKERMRRVSEEGQEAPLIEEQFIRLDGTVVDAEVVATPITYQGKPAVQVVARDTTERKRSERELQQSVKKAQKALEGTVHALAATIERRDPYTAGHQQNVAQLAYAIAREMNLSKEQSDGTRMAGILHDIGKIGIPAEILSTPGRLTEPEFAVVKTHAQIGYDILREIEFPWPVAQIVYQHHERMDGSGYPQGLSSENILLEARILGVSDVVESISSHRPYRPALGIDKALEEISQHRGVLYDPDVVDACLKVFTQSPHVSSRPPSGQQGSDLFWRRQGRTQMADSGHG